LYRTAPLVILALVLASCGSGSSTTSETTVSEESVKSKETAPATAKPVKRDTSGEPCDARLGDFVDRMNDLRQSLLAGLSYDEYVVRVRAIRDAYEAVPVDKLGASCVSGPAAEAEDAFNQYLRAANAWGECAATAGCAASEVEGKLQRRWKQASTKLDAAEKPS
jgi:hypothetical protein